MTSQPAETGRMRIDDRWVTALAFEASRDGDRVDGVEVRFMENDREIARASLKRAEALALLGERNVASLEREIRAARPEETLIKGELRGSALHYHEAGLAAAQREEENTLEAAPLRALRLQPHMPQPVQAAQAMRTASVPAGPEVRDTPPAPPDPRAMPAHIAAKFLQDGERYCFADGTLAFVDRGTKLRAETENRAVIHDLVQIAKARGWEAGAVRGTESFRRAVWQEAYVEGFVVQGYKPSALELQAAQRERVRRFGPDEFEHLWGRAAVQATVQGQGPTGTAGKGTRQAPLPADMEKVKSGHGGTPKPTIEVVYGKLLAHGEAPYQFDSKNDPSYYVKLAFENGREQTYWGIDLQEAVRSGNTCPRIGDAVGICIVGQRSVTVMRRSVDGHGKLNVEPVDTVRNAWVVEKAAYFTEPGRLDRDIAARAAQSAKEPAPVPRAAEMETPSRERSRARKPMDVVYGKLLAHGEAHYKFDPDNGRSYYVKLALENGREQTYWGMDLQEAFSGNTAPAIGDAVSLRTVSERSVRVMPRPRYSDAEARVESVDMSRNAAGRIERDAAVRATHSAKEPAPVFPAAEMETPSSRRSRTRKPMEVVYGKLLAHGEAHYKFDPDNGRSYYIKLALENGREQTYWGMDLQEAFSGKTAPAIGDAVSLRTVNQRSISAMPRPQYSDVEARVESVDMARNAAGPVERDGGVRAVQSVKDQAANVVEQPQREEAARNPRATREEFGRRNPEGEQAVDAREVRDKFVQQFVDAGLVRPHEREKVMRIFEAKVAERERQGRPVQFSGTQAAVEIQKAVQRETEEIARTPAAVTMKVRTPEPQVHSDVHVRA